MKRKITPYIYILFLLGNLTWISGQEIKLDLSVNHPKNNLFLSQLKYRTKLTSKQAVLKEIDTVLFQLTQLGFLNPKIGQSRFIDSVYSAELNLGQQIKTARLRYNPAQLSEKDLKRLRAKVKGEHITIPFELIQATLEKITGLLDQRGQGFSIVKLKSIRLEGDRLSANLFITESKQRHIDKIIIEGYPKLSIKYVHHYLRLKPGHTFRKSDLDQFYLRINTIPFISQIKTPEVLFTNDSTHIYFFLKKKMINQFDGLLGFNSKEGGGGLQFNGYIDLALGNLFNGGEQLNFSWKNNGQNQQRLTLGVNLPYFLNSKISPSYQLNVFKQDSAYVNSTTALNLGYAIKFNQTIGLNAQWENSSVSNQLLDTPNYSHFYLGGFYNYNLPNADILFREKIKLNINVYFGNRKSTTNSPQSRLDISGSYLWQLKSQHHIYIANQTKLLWSDSYLTNELLRFGGANSIRGFNEDQFFSNAYSFFNLEYRFNPNNETYFYSITDFGATQNKKINISEQLYSFGLGYAFQTNLGKIDLSYALGGIHKNAINVGNSRLHLKFIANF